jgi:hypothetical protein
MYVSIHAQRGRRGVTRSGTVHSETKRGALVLEMQFPFLLHKDGGSLREQPMWIQRLLYEQGLQTRDIRKYANGIETI